MALAKCSDDEFIKLFQQHGATELSKILETNVRSVFSRRRSIESRIGYSLNSPNASLKILGESTLYDAEGEVKLTWVKTTADKEKQEQIFRDGVLAMSKKLPRLKPINSPAQSLPDLLNLYTLTDFHLGMLGDDWDNKTAEDVLINCFSEMINNSPKAHTAIICQLGDFLHSDYPGLRSETPLSGHQLNSDGEPNNIIASSIKLLRRVVDASLTKHENVHVIMAEGNHDITSSIWLRHMFDALYEDNPRVTIDTSDLPYYVHHHGDTMLAFHHGHLKKFSTLTSVFAATFPEIWGKTKYRYAHCGHLHHAQVKEDMGMTVTQHRTLASKDAYSKRLSYFSERKAESTTYHKKFGQVASNYVTPEMII